MDDFKRNPDENERQYIWRICSSKNNIGSWQDIADLFGKELSYKANETDCLCSLYMHVNKADNKKYIGITTLPVTTRWHTDGSGYKNQKLFYRAINKYGWNNFEHIVLFSELPSNKAYELEKIFIGVFNTTNRTYGYNISSGGENISIGAYNIESMSTPVYQYTIDGDFVNGYPSMMEAQRQTGISNSNICACCKGKHAYINGYRWRYTKCDKLEPLDIKRYIYENVTKKSTKIVYQYNLKGEFICAFDSVTEASKSTGTSSNSISTCGLEKRKQANGFMWSYIYLESFPPYRRKYRSLKNEDKLA